MLADHPQQVAHEGLGIGLQRVGQGGRHRMHRPGDLRVVDADQAEALEAQPAAAEDGELGGDQRLQPQLLVLAGDELRDHARRIEPEAVGAQQPVDGAD